MFYKNIKNQARQFLDKYKSDNPATYAAAQQAIGGILVLDGFVGIDNPLGGKKRSGIFGSFIGIIVGLFFVFGVGFMGNILGVNKLTSTTTATVISVSQSTPTKDASGKASATSCTPQAKYNVDGKEYTQTASSGSSSACSLTAGQTIDINYNPNNPGEWAYDLKTVKTILKAVPYFGGLIVLISLITFLIRLLSIIFGWKLIRSGRALAKTLPGTADLTTIKNEVKQNFAKSVFGMGNNHIFNQPVLQNQTENNTPPTPPQTPVL